MCDSRNHELETEAAGDALGRGLACYRAGDYAGAVAAFAAACDAAPGDANAQRLHGLALVRAGRASEGLPWLARARRRAWGDALAHLHHGIGLLEAGQPARAAAVLRRAVSMAPGDAAGWVNFSAALRACGQAKAARAAARRAVAAAPDLAEARQALGLAEQAAGDAAAAAAAFRAAIGCRADYAPAWVELGLIAYRDGRAGEAAEAMRRALAADPACGAAAANLAAFELLSGETDGAIARLQAVLARDPGCVPARLNLANALLMEQRTAEAGALLEGGVPAGEAGHHWRAHRALVLLAAGRRQAAQAELDAVAPPYGDAAPLVLRRRLLLARAAGDRAAEAALVAALERVLDEGAEGLSEHRAIAHFDLGRLHAAAGRGADAFRHWTAGHRIIARFQPHDRARLTAHTDASVAHFAGPCAVRAGNDDPAPVFIVGMPRSGTTLAEQILASHGAVHGAGERAAVYTLVNALTDGWPETAEGARRLAALDAAALDDAARRFLDELHALAPGAARVVDKMPGNARHLGFLARLLPGARFIHCTRDPRDIGLSIFQHRFFGYHPYAHDLGDLGHAIGEHARLMAHWRSVLGGRLIEVALTDWIEDFDATLARVLDFLGLEHDPACARFYEQGRRVRTASAAQVRRPVNADGIGRHRAYLRELRPLLDELERAGLIDATTESESAA